MKEMTAAEAQLEAERQWGPGGAIHELRPPGSKRHGRQGRLRPYRFTVGNNRLGPTCSIKGQGDTWRQAFADAARVAASTSSRAYSTP